MLQTIRLGISVLLLGPTLAGCARQTCCCSQPGGRARRAGEVAVTLPVIERIPIAPDLSALGSYEAVELVLGEQLAPSQYRGLDAEQCQCLAAANSSLGKFYDSQSRLGTGDSRSPSRSKAAAVRCDIWALLATQERNESASRALQLFYLLAEAEFNHDALHRNLREVDRALSNFQQLKARGLQITEDEGALRRQRTDTLDRRDQLFLTIARLNEELRQLLGFDVNDTMPIWPLTDLKVAVTPVDVEDAIRTGMAMRPDLGMLSMMYEELDADTLPAIRAGMLRTAGMLNVPSPSRRRVFRSVASGELQSRRRQICELLAGGEQAAAGEIRLAAHTIETQLRRIALAAETLESWKLRFDQVLQKRTVGETTPFDVSAARLAVIQAESELVHQVVAWEIARVKLRAAQGLLAHQCGY